MHGSFRVELGETEGGAELSHFNHQTSGKNSSSTNFYWNRDTKAMQ